MLIQGTDNKDRENLLIKKYSDLIQQGAGTEEILVIVLNPYKKSVFTDRVIEICPELNKSEIKAYTHFGLCYNSFVDNIDYVKRILKCKDDDVLNLCGLEVSQYIFKQSIKEADFSDYISKVNLLHQLFRRYSLIVQNNLTNEEVIKRSKMLNETFYQDAQKAINDYKLKTIKYKSFDYLRQLAIFPLIYRNTDYFKNIKYLLVNDADEIPYIIWEFIYYILDGIKDYLIAYDKDGTTRCGYLCAYKGGIDELKKRFPVKEINLIDKSIFASTALMFKENITKGIKTKIDNIEYSSTIRRLDMFDKVISDIKHLISNGVNQNEILIVTPLLDNISEHIIFSNTIGLNFQIISGSEKLSDIKTIKYIITILKIINETATEEYEIKNLLTGLLKIPYRKYCKITNGLKRNAFFENIKPEDRNYDERYNKLVNIINSLYKKNYTITEQIKIIYSNLIAESDTEEGKQKYNFLLKEAESFENAFKNSINDINKEFILQIENSLISENPINAVSIKNNSRIAASPQKIIDFGIKRKYQLWLDISNNEWLKQDTGTLYNSWVLNRDWTKDKYILEDNIAYTRDKTARIVRKLMLNAQKEIRFYSSYYDNNGNENFGGLSDYIEIKNETKEEFKIIPRTDQKPVLEYKKGKMGVMAVPGAGKTTILLALIIKLLKSGINPENIFVLTYMESAAKNFKERIKAGISGSPDLPNISTIHGLALRIIKENGNYSRIGLDENFEICDDNEKERIIKELFYKLKIADDKYDNYTRSISIVKLSANHCTLSSKYPDIQEFFNFLNEYNAALKQKNLIDYDDMLRYSVELLENNKDIAQYYQNICKYIIEDEAQDSSEIQQTLIKLLSEKYKNVVRCGDINQSITATFTNSNLKSFRQFIENNKKVEMVSSQRCSEQIYNLANKMTDAAQKNENTINAFYPIKIEGTKNNPKTNEKPEFFIFENESEEKKFILNRIKEIQNNNKNASIAILLRLNSQVNEYNSFLNTNGFKTSVRSDCLNQKLIYKYTNTILNIINNPLNNTHYKLLAELYSEKYNNACKNEAIKFLTELKTPFIEMNPDEITNEMLLQLYWDSDYWLNNSNKPIEEIALEIGMYYSKNSIDKSNTFLVSTFIKRLKTGNENTTEIIKKLEYNAQKSLSAYKFFEEEPEQTNNAINIMTMHKSKGDEFDYVFIPQLNEENYALKKENIKLKSGSHFVQTIKHLVENSPIKTNDELKTEQLEETLRLLYVGITRAKKSLLLSSAKQYRVRKNVKPCEFFELLLQNN